MQEFADKVVLVTGGSTGMGRACSQRFRDAGASVLIVANDPASTEQAAAEIGNGAAAFVGDVRNAPDMEQAVA